VAWSINYSLPPVASVNTLFTPGAGAVSVVGAPGPSLLTPQFLQPGAGALNFTGIGAIAIGALTLQPSTGTLALAGAAAQPVQSAVRTPTAGAMAVGGATPALLTNFFRIPPAAAVVATGVAPTVTNSSGGATPGVPTSVQLFASGMPGAMYATFAMPVDNGSAITQFEGLLSGGVTGIQPRFTLGNSTIDALSCRVDFYNVANSSQTCQIRAHNANGSGSYSSASSAVTPPAFSDTWVDGSNCHYIICGGGTTGLSSLWHDGYFNNQNVRYVAPGTATLAGTLVPTMNAPAYPTGVGMTSQLMAELTAQGAGGYGYLVNILSENPAFGTNGVFNSNPYSRFVFYIYPTQSGTHAAGRIETTINMEGVVSGVAGAVNTFANQTMATNTFVGGSTAMFDRTSTGSSGWTSNTASTITSDNAGGLASSIGDHINTQVGDQLVGNDAGDIAQYVISPSAGTLTLNVWNRVEIPLGPTGWNMHGANNGMHYKQNIAMPSPAPKGVAYFCKMGYAV
jgi:hypothetical protein